MARTYLYSASQEIHGQGSLDPVRLQQVLRESSISPNSMTIILPNYVISSSLPKKRKYTSIFLYLTRFSLNLSPSAAASVVIRLVMGIMSMRISLAVSIVTMTFLVRGLMSFMMPTHYGAGQAILYVWLLPNCKKNMWRKF